jgi:hypothetical protein
MALHPGPYYVGGSITLDIKFKDAASAYIDPETVTLRIVKPDGSEIAYVFDDGLGIGRTSTGIYYSTITPGLGGRHHYRWETTNPITVKEGNFIVQRSEFSYPTTATVADDYWEAAEW